MHPHQGFALGGDVAAREGEMHVARGLVLEGRQAEAAVHGVDVLFADLFHQVLGGGAVLDEVADGADLEGVFLGELDEVGQARHGAVVLQDLADHRGRLQARELGEVAASLGVAGADQHAALLRGEREDVAGGDDVFRLGMTSDGSLHGTRPVVGRDAGGHTSGGLDRHRERGAVRGAVVAHHLLQAELAAALVGEGQADQAAAEAGHEVDRLGGDEFGRHDEVALVLTVLFVHQDDHLAGLDVGDDLGNRRECAHAVSSIGLACS